MPDDSSPRDGDRRTERSAGRPGVEDLALAIRLGLCRRRAHRLVFGDAADPRDDQAARLERHPSAADRGDRHGQGDPGGLDPQHQPCARVAAGRRRCRHHADGHLQEAVELEYELRYDEPPTWFYPCRQNLGAVLIEAGKYEEAEKVYRENLAEIPDNGWGLFGLHQALIKQNKTEEASEVEKKFNAAWQYSDVKLNSSRIM